MIIDKVETGDVIVDSVIEVLFDDMRGQDNLSRQDVEGAFRLLCALCDEEPEMFDCAGYVLYYLIYHEELTKGKAEAALDFLEKAMRRHPKRDQRAWLAGAYAFAEHKVRERVGDEP